MGIVLVFLVSLLAACSLSTEDLAKEVRASIEETFEENGISVTIESFSLVKRNKTEYHGVLVTTSYGVKETTSVNVVYDGKYFSWELE
jgi:hypothetical protein